MVWVFWCHTSTHRLGHRCHCWCDSLSPELGNSSSHAWLALLLGTLPSFPVSSVTHPGTSCHLPSIGPDQRGERRKSLNLRDLFPSYRGGGKQWGERIRGQLPRDRSKLLLRPLGRNESLHLGALTVAKKWSTALQCASSRAPRSVVKALRDTGLFTLNCLTRWVTKSQAGLLHMGRVLRADC